MGRFTKIIYQVVFGTYRRQPLMIEREKRHRLQANINATIQGEGCFVYIVNGVEDHVHLLFDLTPSKALSDVVQTVKVVSNKFAKKELGWKNFKWQRGYGAFTYSPEALPNLIAYIERQEEHHRKKTFRQEFVQLLERHQVSYEDAWIDED